MKRKWKRTSFSIGVPPAEMRTVQGYTYRHVGIHEDGLYWSVTHLNSGHRVALLLGALSSGG